MPSSPISHSRFPSSTNVALGAAVASLVAGAGCNGDETCGVGDAPAVGLVAGNSEVTLTYGNLTSLVGNDCSDPDVFPEIVSVSIEGTQTDGSGGITLCIPRPDLLTEGGRTLGTATSMADVRIIDLSGMAGNCTFEVDAAQPPTGDAVGFGVCANGDDPAGFALELDGAISLTRTCGTVVDTIAVTLTGKVAVERRE